MDINRFLQLDEARIRPVFVTTKELRVRTCTWIPGESPYIDPVDITVPAGTELTICSHSNFGESHSMSFVTPKDVLPPGKRNARWAAINYADIEYKCHRLFQTWSRMRSHIVIEM